MPNLFTLFCQKIRPPKLHPFSPVSLYFFSAHKGGELQPWHGTPTLVRWVALSVPQVPRCRCLPCALTLWAHRLPLSKYALSWCPLLSCSQVNHGISWYLLTCPLSTSSISKLYRCCHFIVWNLKSGAVVRSVVMSGSNGKYVLCVDFVLFVNPLGIHVPCLIVSLLAGHLPILRFGSWHALTF